VAPAAHADFINDTLASAGPANWAILSTGNASPTDFALNGPGTTTGNVGVGPTGNLQLNSSIGTAIVGNVYLSSGSTISHPGQVQGTIFTGADALLNQAATDAQHAATTFAGLAPTSPITTIDSSTKTIVGSAGVNVLNITDLNLNGAHLTLSAPAGGQFVINDSGGFVLNSGVIDLAGGLTPSDVVFNLTGSSPGVMSSGGGNASVLNGILLAENRTIDFSPGLINGEAISDSDHIHFVSGAEVNQVPPSPPPMVPEPASMLLVGLGLPAFAACAYRSRRLRSAPQS
jgi:choice-of-anchor A domain-containing protein